MFIQLNVTYNSFSMKKFPGELNPTKVFISAEHGNEIVKEVPVCKSRAETFAIDNPPQYIEGVKEIERVIRKKRINPDERPQENRQRGGNRFNNYDDYDDKQSYIREMD